MYLYICRSSMGTDFCFVDSKKLTGMRTFCLSTIQFANTKSLKAFSGSINCTEVIIRRLIFHFFNKLAEESIFKNIFDKYHLKLNSAKVNL